MFSKLKTIIYALTVFTALAFAHSAYAAITIRPMLNAGLVGYWSMDEGSGNKAYDQSGNRNTGTLTQMDPATDWVDGKLGRALDFDGTDDYVALGDPATLDVRTSNFTISGWAKLSAKGGDREIVGWGYTNSAIECRYDLGDDLWEFNASDGGNWRYAKYSQAQPSLNTWYHVACVRSGNTLTIYVNGVKGATEDTLAGEIADDATNNWHIGRLSGTGGYGRYFSGPIDEVRIYNRALSAGEIQRLYNLTKPKILAPNNTGLVGYWSMEEGMGTKVGDMSGNGNNGDITGASWTDGKRGKALSFNGSSGSVIAADTNNTLDATSAVTISIWFYPNTLNSGWRVLASKDGGSNSNYWLGTNDSKFALTFRTNGTGAWNNHYTNNDYTPGQWYHVVGIIDSANNNMRMYINNVLDIDSQSETDNMSANNSSLYIGYDNGNNTWINGIIDEVRIYNRALGAAEVATLYTASKKITKVNTSQNNKLTDGLVGLWSFNGPDISGSIAYDRSGQNNHGAITGAVPTIGKVGQALSFNGTSDYVNVGPLNWGGWGATTISLWWYARTFPEETRLIHKNDDTSGSGSHYFMLSNYSAAPVNALRARFNINSTVNTLNSDANYTETGKWIHTVVVYNGSQVIYYKDGTQFGAADSLSGTLTADNTAVTGIGAGPTDIYMPFNGLIDEVRIYNRALSASEIKRLYNMGR